MPDPSVNGPAPSVDTRTEADGSLIIQPHPELDAEHFRHLLVQAVRKTRPQRLVVDLGDLPTLDAIHLGTLTALCDLADDQQIPVVLANPTTQVRSALLTAGVTPDRIRYVRETVSVETPEVASTS